MNTLRSQSNSVNTSGAEPELGGVHVAPGRHRTTTSAGDAPRTVIRGESLTTPPVTSPITVLTDWVDFTFPLEHSRYAINGFFRSLIEIVGDSFAPLTERGKGINGWGRSYSLGNSFCIFAIGGQRGRALLSFSGKTCAQIQHSTWPILIELIRDQYEGRITRWDGAADDHEGIHSIEWALDQYDTGGFKSGGNRPRVNTIGDWIRNEGRGRTLEIGSRKNGKLVRIYEKGKQLGDRHSPWVRWELELHRKHRDIPWDVITNPGKYIAGAYPCMNWVHGEASRIKTYKTTVKIGYESLTYHARQAYGPLINIMLAVEKSPERVIEKLIRPGKPSRLDMPAPPECIDQIKDSTKR